MAERKQNEPSHAGSERNVAVLTRCNNTAPHLGGSASTVARVDSTPIE